MYNLQKAIAPIDKVFKQNDVKTQYYLDGVIITLEGENGCEFPFLLKGVTISSIIYGLKGIRIDGQWELKVRACHGCWSKSEILEDCDEIRDRLREIIRECEKVRDNLYS